MSNALSIFDTVGAANAGAELGLKHPVTGEQTYLDHEKENPEKPMTIYIVGADSDAFEKETVKAMRSASREKKGAKFTQEDIDKTKLKNCETYARLTTGWKNIPGDDDKPMEFSFDNAVRLYMKYKDIRIQVGAAVENKELFIKS